MHIVVMNICILQSVFFCCWGGGILCFFFTYSKPQTTIIFRKVIQAKFILLAMSIWKKYWIILLLCTKGLGHFVV